MKTHYAYEMQGCVKSIFCVWKQRLRKPEACHCNRKKRQPPMHGAVYCFPGLPQHEYECDVCNQRVQLSDCWVVCGVEEDAHHGDQKEKVMIRFVLCVECVHRHGREEAGCDF